MSIKNYNLFKMFFLKIQTFMVFCSIFHTLTKHPKI